jgi:hypothetical protein
VARSVVELLPQPFADLTVEDVEQIVTPDPGEPRETLWLERKATFNSGSLSKACAAFANTYGGLLVIGVEDGSDTLVGIDPLDEPELRVKDVLRGNVLPMPPFRARMLPLDNGRAILLVLVEQSSATPHMLLRNGAIYVRNPGSSDPVTIDDQRRLLDLTARGERAVERARANARAAASEHVTFDPDLFADAWAEEETLAIAPTGISDEFDARIFDAATPPAINQKVWGQQQDPRLDDQRYALWAQPYVGVRRTHRPAMSFNNERAHEAVTVDRTGTFRAARGHTINPGGNVGSLRVDDKAKPWLTTMLTAGRDILTE